MRAFRHCLRLMFISFALLFLFSSPEAHAAVPEGEWTEDEYAYFSFLSTDLYVDAIENPVIREACEEQYIDNFFTFRDLNSDGVEELILWLGYTGADGEMLVFTIDGGAVVCIGSAPCDGTGTGLFCADHDDDFFFASYDGSGLYADAYRIVRGSMKLISSDAMVPHRWYAVDWVGSLPLEFADDEYDPASPEASLEALGEWAEFVGEDGYAFYLEDMELYDRWYLGCASTFCWLADIENDGSEELIVWVSDDNGRGEVLVFEEDSFWPEYVGSVACEGPIGISDSETVPGIMLISNGICLEQITLCRIGPFGLGLEEYYMPTDTSWQAVEICYMSADPTPDPDVYHSFVADGGYIEHVGDRELRSLCRDAYADTEDDTFVFNWYCLFDLGQDGVSELIMWLGDGEVYGELLIFGCVDDEVYLIGRQPCAGTGVYPQAESREHGIIVPLTEIDGLPAVHLTVDGDELCCEELRDTDTFGWTYLFELEQMYALP